jgi:hypothetical protein
MGQLKLISPSNVLPLRDARVWNRQPNDQGEAKANTYRPGDIEPPLPLTPERLGLIKAYAENVLGADEGSSASKIAQRFSRLTKPAPLPGDPQSALHWPLVLGVRRLTIVLLAVALLPNLTLAAFWLGLIDPRTPVTLSHAESHPPSVQSAIVRPVLSAPDMLEARGGEGITLPVALDGTDGVPPGSLIVIRGLPPGSTLSSGRRQGETDWVLRPDEIGDLRLIAPAGGSGEFKLIIQLLAPSNGILADAATTLKISAIQTSSLAADATAAEPQQLGTPDQKPQAQVLDRGAASADPKTSTPDLPPLPTRRSDPSANNNEGADWIRPSAYVNLRQSPSSSASVAGVIAKGAKLRVLGRKRGWVQVTNPVTSQSGWVYSGNTDIVR